MKLINEAVAILRVQSDDLDAVAARYRKAEEFGAANKVLRTAAYIDYAATLLAESEAVLEVYGSAGEEEYDVVSSKFKSEVVKAEEPVSILDRELEILLEETNLEALVGKRVTLNPGSPYEQFKGQTGTVVKYSPDSGYGFEVEIDGEFGTYAFYPSEVEALPVPTGRDLVGKIVKLTNPDIDGFEQYIGQEFKITGHDPEGYWALNGRYPYVSQRVTDGRVLAMNDSEFEVL